MIKTINRRFEEDLDIVQVISKPAREKLGEDSYYCGKSRYSAVISVCDGCGGLGARTYEAFDGHTGAYVASRTVSGALRDWYHVTFRNNNQWKNTEELADSADAYIQKGYTVCNKYGKENSRIMGSMIRRFPTTLAFAYAESEGDGVTVHIVWAGDSRVYLLDRHGLAQLTMDDTDVEDALENLTSDGAMNNVLSSDGNYILNTKTIHITEPSFIFAATDGCFGYVSSPMEFENILLTALMENNTPVRFKKALKKTLASYAGDDLAMGMMSFFFGSYPDTQKQLSGRFRELREKYIRPLESQRSDDRIRQLWEKYKLQYERFLKQSGEADR